MIVHISYPLNWTAVRCNEALPSASQFTLVARVGMGLSVRCRQHVAKAEPPVISEISYCNHAGFSLSSSCRFCAKRCSSRGLPRLRGPVISVRPVHHRSGLVGKSGGTINHYQDVKDLFIVSARTVYRRGRAFNRQWRGSRSRRRWRPGDTARSRQDRQQRHQSGAFQPFGFPAHARL